MTEYHPAAVIQLAGSATRGVVTIVEETQAAVNRRTFAMIRLALRAVTAVATRVVDHAPDLPRADAEALLAEGETPEPAPTAGRTDRALALVSGMYGDRLTARQDARDAPDWAGMSLRSHEAVLVGAGAATDEDAEVAADVVADAVVAGEAVAARVRSAYPQVSGRIVVFVHGLMETEADWGYRAQAWYGDPSVTYGSRLQGEGWTPVWVRYNTGRSVETNGHVLRLLLDDLVSAWPVPVADLALVGHSMGGLVIRAAFDDRQDPDGVRRALTSQTPVTWPQRVRTVITLGTPHLGAPLARAAARVESSLIHWPEATWLRHVIGGRSIGIRDLERGLNRRIESEFGDRVSGELPATVAHHFVAGTLAATDTGGLAHVMGDGMVSMSSAHDQSVASLASPDRQSDAASQHAEVPSAQATRWTAIGVSHMGLLNHDGVYAQLREWLAAS